MKQSEANRDRSIAEQSDLLVLALWTIFVIGVVVVRQDFIGDGVRHLGHILSSNRPALGEPRWLLFPTVLFVVIRPLVLAGLVNTVDEATRAFAFFNVFCGLLYLFALRAFLIARDVTPGRRAIALLLAGMAAPIVMLGSNADEPLVAAVIAVAGLAYAAKRSADPRRATPGVVVAVGAIAIATLIFQGLFLAVALLPCAVPLATLVHRRTLISAGGVLALVPLVMVGALVYDGNSPGHALGRVLRGEENELYLSLRRSQARPVWSWVAALTVGPVEGIAPIPQNRGILGTVRLLRQPPTLLTGVAELAALACCAALLATLLLEAARRGDWPLLVGFAGILVLPFWRNHQYSYLKFYVLLPVLLALGATRMRSVRWAAAGAIAVAAINGVILASRVSDYRAMHDGLAPVYADAVNTCWISMGWSGPPVLGWPGSTASMIRALERGRIPDPALRTKANNVAFRTDVERCFCKSSSVITNDMTVESKDSVIGLAKHFGLEGMDLERILWRLEHGELIWSHDARRAFRYSRVEQTAICADLTRQSAER